MLALALLLPALCFAACGGAPGAASPSGAGGEETEPSPSAACWELAGKEVLPSPSGEELYDRLCRCLYPYLLTQEARGYRLFADGAFYEDDYLSLLHFVILQEHRDQAQKEEVTPFGQPVFYFQQTQYEGWYRDLFPKEKPGPAGLVPKVMDGTGWARVPEMGYGSVRLYTIKEAACGQNGVYTVTVEAASTESEEKQELTFSVALGAEGFQYLSVEARPAEP